MSEGKIHKVAGFSSSAYWFRVKIKNFPLNQICQSCRCITPQLSTLSCGHWYCDVCLKGLRVREKLTAQLLHRCAFCRKDSCGVRMITEVRKSELECMPASCANNGCSFAGTVFDVKKHTPFCPVTTEVSCLKCGCRLERAQISHHLRVQCNYKIALPSPVSSPRLPQPPRTSNNNSLNRPKTSPALKEKTATMMMHKKITTTTTTSTTTTATQIAEMVARTKLQQR